MEHTTRFLAQPLAFPDHRRSAVKVVEQLTDTHQPAESPKIYRGEHRAVQKSYWWRVFKKKWLGISGELFSMEIN